MDVVSFCKKLIRCRSVTPCNDGAIGLISKYLSKFGFETNILTFSSPDSPVPVTNLFAKYRRSDKKILGFLGHSDVVPAGEGWNYDPFLAVVKDGFLIGRGAADMKGGIAAFCSAAIEFVSRKDFDGTIEILITGDEEIGSYAGARSLIDWCLKNVHIPHDCLIGEPSSNEKIGDRVYVGHRGSLNIKAEAIGKQGHVAYPGNYRNSLADICLYVSRMLNYKWKHEDKDFPTTNLEPTMLFTDNLACNIVPEKSVAAMNIRYSRDYTVDGLIKICHEMAADLDVSLEFSNSGGAYLCAAENMRRILSEAISENTGITPEFATGGGISDGRYMIPYCNIIEFGLQDVTIHQKNEKIRIDDLVMLKKIYESFIEKYFS